MGGVSITIKILNLDELRRKLNGQLLYQPEIAEGLEQITDRFKRGGRGLGARRNIVTSSREGSNRYRIRTTKHNPRQTGLAWARKNQSIFKSMAPRITRKIIERIRSRWAS